MKLFKLLAVFTLVLILFLHSLFIFDNIDTNKCLKSDILNLLSMNSSVLDSITHLYNLQEANVQGVTSKAMQSACMLFYPATLGGGSCFLIDRENGLFVTARHVAVYGKQYYSEIQFPGSENRAAVECGALSGTVDLALLNKNNLKDGI